MPAASFDYFKLNFVGSKVSKYFSNGLSYDAVGEKKSKKKSVYSKKKKVNLWIENIILHLNGYYLEKPIS